MEQLVENKDVRDWPSDARSSRYFGGYCSPSHRLLWLFSWRLAVEKKGLCVSWDASLASGRLLYTRNVSLYPRIVGDIPIIHSIPHPGRQLISPHAFLEWSTIKPRPAVTSLSASGNRPSLGGRAKRTAWPRLKGWTSRKANTRADS